MLMQMVENYSWKGSFRGYSYRQEMVSEALVQLVSPGTRNPIPPVLRFDATKAAKLDITKPLPNGAKRQVNGFAYCTSIIYHAFLRFLNKEKQHAELRDDLRVMAGVNPSYTRINDDDDNRSSEPIPPKPKPMGRPKGFKPSPRVKPITPVAEPLPKPLPKKRGPKAKPKPPKVKKPRKLHVKNKNGVTGVTWRPTMGKWQAGLGVKGKKLHLGIFADYDEAVAARKAAEIQYGIP